MVSKFDECYKIQMPKEGAGSEIGLKFKIVKISNKKREITSEELSQQEMQKVNDSTLNSDETQPEDLSIPTSLINLTANGEQKLKKRKANRKTKQQLNILERLFLEHCKNGTRFDLSDTAKVVGLTEQQVILWWKRHNQKYKKYYQKTRQAYTSPGSNNPVISSTYSIAASTFENIRPPPVSESGLSVFPTELDETFEVPTTVHELVNMNRLVNPDNSLKVLDPTLSQTNILDQSAVSSPETTNTITSQQGPFSELDVMNYLEKLLQEQCQKVSQLEQQSITSNYPMSNGSEIQYEKHNETYQKSPINLLTPTNSFSNPAEMDSRFVSLNSFLEHQSAWEKSAGIQETLVCENFKSKYVHNSTSYSHIHPNYSNYPDCGLSNCIDYKSHFYSHHLPVDKNTQQFYNMTNTNSSNHMRWFSNSGKTVNWKPVFYNTQ